jgi:HAD superfamily 5'-nucleotidase-like hydrolase
MPHRSPPSARERVLACNRTLNLRAIKAVGYDMDYTLVHYQVEEWERRAYEHIRQRLSDGGWPVDHLEFRETDVIRGLVIDKLKGNLVKANRFGFVKKAVHGTRPLEYEQQRWEYQHTQVDLADSRWEFLNTLFSLSEGCIYRQLVDLLDEGKLPEVMGYADLYERVRHATDATHMEGELKAEILSDPERYVLLDEETALTLLDQKHSGKKLLLITNSEWSYTLPMMTYAFDRYLPDGMGWQDLFDVVIASARKPTFFQRNSPLYEVVDDDGLLRPVDELEGGRPHAGGSAQKVETHLGLSGDEILYVGDHMFGDVHVTKDVLRWRTALILRELEGELRAVEAFEQDERALIERMAAKEALEAKHCAARVELQRLERRYGPKPSRSHDEISASLSSLRAELNALDDQISPLAKAAAEQGNAEWGLVLRAGNDKSHLARQVERYADVYTSRVSNFLQATPFTFLRSRRGSLPHDGT